MVWNKIKLGVSMVFSGIFKIIIALGFILVTIFKKMRYDFTGFIKDLILFSLIVLTARYIVFNQSNVPEFVYIGSFIFLSLWIAISVEDDIELASGFSIHIGVLTYLLGICTFRYILWENPYIGTSGLMGYVVDMSSALGGLVLLVLTVMMFSGVILSILGYGSNKLSRERMERIDDPYGDKHAQDILNDEDDNKNSK